MADVSARPDETSTSRAPRIKRSRTIIASAAFSGAVAGLAAGLGAFLIGGALDDSSTSALPPAPPTTVESVPLGEMLDEISGQLAADSEFQQTIAARITELATGDGQQSAVDGRGPELSNIQASVVQLDRACTDPSLPAWLLISFDYDDPDGDALNVPGRLQSSVEVISEAGELVTSFMAEASISQESDGYQGNATVTDPVCTPLRSDGPNRYFIRVSATDRETRPSFPIEVAVNG